LKIKKPELGRYRGRAIHKSPQRKKPNPTGSHGKLMTDRFLERSILIDPIGIEYPKSLPLFFYP